jgi:hypothetical protein
MRPGAKLARMRRGDGVLLLLTLLAGCGGGQPRAARTPAGDSLTERQRDSILARSRIPGASAVGRAMGAADSTTARIRAADSITP